MMVGCLCDVSALLGRDVRLLAGQGSRGRELGNRGCASCVAPSLALPLPPTLRLFPAEPLLLELYFNAWASRFLCCDNTWPNLFLQVSALLSSILSAAEPLLPGFNASEVAGSMHALARLGERPPAAWSLSLLERGREVLPGARCVVQFKL